jgi:hypothetical protein
MQAGADEYPPLFHVRAIGVVVSILSTQGVVIVA